MGGNSRCCVSRRRQSAEMGAASDGSAEPPLSGIRPIANPSGLIVAWNTESQPPQGDRLQLCMVLFIGTGASETAGDEAALDRSLYAPVGRRPLFRGVRHRKDFSMPLFSNDRFWLS